MNAARGLPLPGLSARKARCGLAAYGTGDPGAVLGMMSETAGLRWDDAIPRVSGEAQQALGRLNWRPLNVLTSSTRCVLPIELSDDPVLFACADTHRAIVVFLGDARIAVSENRAGEVWMIATVDGGC